MQDLPRKAEIPVLRVIDKDDRCARVAEGEEDRAHEIELEALAPGEQTLVGATVPVAVSRRDARTTN